jgi:hypothetical protein
MPSFEFVPTLKLLSNEDTLLELVKAFKAAGENQSKYPFVQIRAFDRDYSGVPVRVEAVQKELHVALIGVSPNTSLTLLPIRAIASVTVENLPNVITSFSKS